MAQRLLSRIEKFGVWWCNVNHHSPMWPIHGQYQCAKCGRHIQVQW